MTATVLAPPRAQQRASSAVRRPRLLEGLGDRPFAVLVAPAGYGKTTLLRQWCEEDPRPSSWLTLDHRHEDPLTLLQAIARAVDAAAATDGGQVLVIDDVDVLRTPGTRETLAGVARRPPEGMT